MKASLKNYRQSPRKVRLVADLVRGKNVHDALNELSFLPKRASGPMAKLISSALANAEQTGADVANLIISKITVDQGVTLKRIRARARGVASRINKRTSNVVVELGTAVQKTAKKEPTEPAKKKTIAKKAPATKKTTAKKTTKKASSSKASTKKSSAKAKATS